MFQFLGAFRKERKERVTGPEKIIIDAIYCSSMFEEIEQTEALCCSKRSASRLKKLSSPFSEPLLPQQCTVLTVV